MNVKKIAALAAQVRSLRSARFRMGNWSCIALSTDSRWIGKEVIAAPESSPSDMGPMMDLIDRLNAAIEPVLEAEAVRLESLIAAEAAGRAGDE